jgi:hypothetical protein
MGVKRCSLAELQAGMIVGQSILDNAGRTILQEGGRLTPMIIGRLEKWGVTTVSIRTDDTTEMQKHTTGTATSLIETASADEKEFMRRVAEQVQERFRSVAGIPLMDELKKIAQQQLIVKGKGAVPRLI